MMLRESAAVAAMGTLYGACTAVLAVRVTQSMFVGTSSADPLILVSAGAVMLLVAILATSLPAYGASRTDSNTLLRAE
jgi:ABC-type antimicrobial peptide transport system permease subunit